MAAKMFKVVEKREVGFQDTLVEAQQCRKFLLLAPLGERDALEEMLILKFSDKLSSFGESVVILKFGLASQTMKLCHFGLSLTPSTFIEIRYSIDVSTILFIFFYITTRNINYKKFLKYLVSYCGRFLIVYKKQYTSERSHISIRNFKVVNYIEWTYVSECDVHDEEEHTGEPWLWFCRQWCNIRQIIIETENETNVEEAEHEDRLIQQKEIETVLEGLKLLESEKSNSFKIMERKIEDDMLY